MTSHDTSTPSRAAPAPVADPASATRTPRASFVVTPEALALPQPGTFVLSAIAGELTGPSGEYRTLEARIARFLMGFRWRRVAEDPATGRGAIALLEPGSPYDLGAPMDGDEVAVDALLQVPMYRRSMADAWPVVSMLERNQWRITYRTPSPAERARRGPLAPYAVAASKLLVADPTRLGDVGRAFPDWPPHYVMTATAHGVTPADAIARVAMAALHTEFGVAFDADERVRISTPTGTLHAMTEEWTACGDDGFTTQDVENVTCDRCVSILLAADEP